MSTFRGDADSVDNGESLASAEDIADAVTWAEEWANKAEDSLVSSPAGGDEVDDYSALHWSNKSSTSASNAATSESNASTSASAASASETASAASAAAALASETAAGISETNAAASETAAGISETNAAASEAAAAVSESNAATSEANAAATLAAAFFTDGTRPMTGNADLGGFAINNVGNVDGRDVSVDGTKLDGIATNANNYSHPNHTGDVTSVGDGAQTIANNAVTNAKLADVATSTIKGRATAATGDPEDLTAAQVRTIINVEDGATADQTAGEIEAIVNHDNLVGFVGNEHVDHSTVSVTAGTGLSGGGTIAANRTLNLDINSLTTDATPDSAADYLATYDASAGAIKKVLLDDLPGGAPGAASVGQSQLKTTTASQSVSLGGGVVGELTLTGGTYTLGWFYGDNNQETIYGFAHGTTYATRASGYNSDGVSRTMYVYSRYVQASPPWDLGDGEIPLFIFAIIENGTGKILGTSVAVDPPWAYHGPTIITPDRISSDGRKYKTIKEYDIQYPTWRPELPPKPLNERRQILNDYSVSPEVEIEIDQAYKNKDMNLHPHCWPNIPNNSQVYMIDPMSPLALELYMQHTEIPYEDQSGMSVSNMIEMGDIIIDNTPVNRAAPDSMIVLPARWR